MFMKKFNRVFLVDHLSFLVHTWVFSPFNPGWALLGKGNCLPQNEDHAAPALFDDSIYKCSHAAAGTLG